MSKYEYYTVEGLPKDPSDLSSGAAQTIELERIADALENLVALYSIFMQAKGVTVE